MLKKIDIISRDKSYSCEIKDNKDESITCKIYQDSLLKFEGKITLNEIYSTISAFKGYTMEEIFNALNDLEKDKFELSNLSDKPELKIKFKVIKKIKELNISLESKSETKNEIIQRLFQQIIEHKKRIENLQIEIKNLSKLKNKEKEDREEKEEKEEKEENNFQEIDITQVKIQRKNQLLKNNEQVKGINLLDDGRISLDLNEAGIAIINPNSLEIVYIVKPAAYEYISLKKGILAIINHEFNLKKHYIISIIKLEEKHYQVIQEIKHNIGFSKLGKLTDGTLLACTPEGDNNDELIFYKEENNSYNKNFSLSFIGPSKFVLQKSDNEIIYSKYPDEIIVYDFVNKLEKGKIELQKKFYIYLGTNCKFEMISEDLLFFLKNKKECFIINVPQQEKVNHFKSDKIIRQIYSIKGKYLFLLKENCIMQYKIENENISLMNEFKTTVDYYGLICLNNKKKKKFITYDNKCNIYELY